MVFDLNVPPGVDELEYYNNIVNDDSIDWGINQLRNDELGGYGFEMEGDIHVEDGEQNLNAENVEEIVEVEDVRENDSDEDPVEDVRTESEFAEQVDDFDTVFDNTTASALEDKLAPGSVVDGADEAFLLYYAYAKHTGFSVRRGNEEVFCDTKELRMKNFVCFCRGVAPTGHIKGRMAVYKKHNTRCNCKAQLRVARKKGGPWMVTTFQKEHNHELLPKDQSYLLRSSRKLSHAKKSMLEALNSAGIPISRACRFMENEAGGPENAGFIRRDAYHHMDNLKRKSKMADGDSTALMQYLVDKSNKEPFFYWNMQKDDNGRLMNFFYCDSRSALDYEYFGDVLSVDTTYKTNKYELICAPFVGINHHLKNCLFGLTFLSDETTETFQWLFSTFLESMNFKEPGVIFSDQCQAMMNAIDSQFKGASHWLCQWHINQNAPSHFGSLKNSRKHGITA